MAAEDRDDKRQKVYRTPSAGLWTATGLVMVYLVLAVAVSILKESGHLLNNQSFECGHSEESRLTQETFLVSLCTGMAVPICFMLLLNIWIKGTFYAPLSLFAIFVVFVAMTVSFAKTWEKENQDIEAFKDRYLELIPLTDVPGISQSHVNDKNCTMLSNVYRWQAEFKCCGLEGYQDWGLVIPDSCLCEGEDKSTGCVGAGNSLVYEKPCLPTVLSFVEKRSSTLWTVMITWITVVGVPASMFVFLMARCCCWLCCEDCYHKLSLWIFKLRGGVEMIPVVFIRKDNDTQPEEEDGNDEEERESCSNGVVVDVSLEKNAVTMIPLSELRRLQEELEPPPVQHQVRCLCIISQKPRSFYTVMIEEGSPLLPADAVLADANKPSTCVWADGHHVFSLEDIVWPKESEKRSSLPL
ncbi:uncharacterized protein LOC133948783 [Platichthys flesus]|uniref:uncharacterized protein LOC133948783 n=1 Tax=Platichthys flesus TaxID=8260 RepID=UPI002DB83011|nr:uncharacterized protein LOC133948783 [Platichthys flesus]